MGSKLNTNSKIKTIVKTRTTFKMKMGSKLNTTSKMKTLSYRRQHSATAYTTLVIGNYTNGLRTLLLHKEVFEVSQTITTVSL